MEKYVRATRASFSKWPVPRESLGPVPIRRYEDGISPAATRIPQNGLAAPYWIVHHEPSDWPIELRSNPRRKPPTRRPEAERIQQHHDHHHGCPERHAGLLAVSIQVWILGQRGGGRSHAD